MKHNLFVIALLLAIFTLSAFTAKADVPNYFKVTATQGTSQVYLFKKGTPTATDIQYSFDGTTWENLPSSTTDGTVPSGAPTIEEGQSLYVKGDNPSGWTSTSANYFSFRFAGSSNLVEVSGNIMSLIDPSLTMTTIPKANCFDRLFASCTTLYSAKNLKLPAMTLNSYCYNYMFYNCNNLTNAPDTLPALTPTSGCYGSMFYGCSKLISSPIICLTGIMGGSTSAGSINNMFNGCSKLTSITVHFTTWYPSGSSSYYRSYYWYYGTTAKNTNTITAPYALMLAPQNSSARNNRADFPSSWTKKYFINLVFNVNGGKWSDGSTDNLTMYGPTGYVPTPKASAEGYIFDHWESASGETWTIETQHQALTFVNATTSKDSTETYYAVYVNTGGAEKVSFNRNGGLWEDESKLDTKTIPSPVAASDVPIVKKNGYTFDSWKDANSTEFVADYTYTTATTFYAQFSDNTYIFYAMGGTWTDTTSNPRKIITSNLSSRNNISYEGYRFVEWNTQADGNGDTFDANNLPASGTTFYAIWTPLYTFDVATNSGTWDGEDNANKAWTKAELSASPTPLTDAVRAGYHFEGWFDSNGNQYTEAEDLLDAPVTFYARFTPEYTFIPNGGTWDDQSTTNKVLFGSFTLPAIARNGYALEGWTPAFTPAKLPAEPTTYTANWTKLTYTFDVATNGGTWEDGTDATTTRTIDDIASLPIPKKNKQSFLGWKDANGQRMHADNLPDEATTYYAQFGELQYLCITALTDNVNIGTYFYRSTVTFDLHYSTDGDEWTKAKTERNTFVTLNKGQKVWLKGTNRNGINTNNYISTNYIKFTISDSVSLSGNLMTLIDGDNPPLEIPGNTSNNYCFGKLFQHITSSDQYCKIISAKDLQLPATLLKEGCYENLFLNNTYLQEAPADLSSAENVPANAYNGMFEGCSSLISAPLMPQVDTISTNGFKAMFKGCSSLQVAPTLPAKRLGKAAYEQMFSGCTSLRQLEVGFFTWSEEQVKTNVYPTYYWMYNVPNTSDFVFRAPCHLDVTSTFDESHTLSDWTYDCIPYDTIITANATTDELPTLSNITVADGVTLTMNEDYAATDITILGGGKMVVSVGKALTAHSITLQGGAYDGEAYSFVYPELEVNGTIQTAEGTPTPMTYNHLLNKAQYYTMAVPIDVNAKEVLYPDGVGAPYKVQTYDGALRAERGAAYNNWTDVWSKYNPFDPATPDITFEAGRGYVVFCKPQAGVYSPLSFPITMDFREEGEAAEKTISAHGYGCTDGMPADKTKSGDVGWNVLGNPFLTTFGGDDYLTLTTEDATLPINYVVVPDNEGTSYEVVPVASASLPAFTHFFVQIFNDGDIHFVRGNKANNAPRRATMASDVAAFGVRVEDANGSADRLGFFLSDDFTDEYDPYYDLSKWQNSGLNLYAKHAGDNLSMMAVSPATMENEIPLTLTIPATGRYTFSLVDEWARNLWAYDHIYLYDKTTSVTTDLTVEDYAFSASQGTSATRFVISAHRNEMPTGNTIVSDHKEDQTKPIKYIEDGKLVILRNGLRYDANGHCLE